MTMFKVGDKAVYPAHGVADVVGVETKEIGGKPTSFFLLRVLENDMRLLVPIEKAVQVGLRPIASTREASEVMEVLRERDVPLDRQTWNRRHRGFMDKIKTGSLFEVAEVFRDLYRRKSAKQLSFGERRMLDMARNLIVRELSIARRWTEEKTEQELAKACLN